MRELKSVANRWALGLPDAPGSEAPPPASGSLGLGAVVDAAERGAIETALRACNGHVAQTADLLQVPKKSLYNKLARHGISAGGFRKH